MLRWGPFLQILIFPGLLYQVAAALFLSWLDRKLVARGQERVGPPWYQPWADLIKLFGKEDIVIRGSSATVGALLPVLSVACVLAAGMCIPIGNYTASSFEGDMIVVLFLLSVPSLTYFLAGWVTPSVYGVIGGNRSLLQYFSYEVPLLLGLAATAVYGQSWNLMSLMDAQRGYHWHVFVMPIGFAIALVGMIGKLKRAPFDIPHAKSEVGAGPLTEYSGRKLALWKLTVSLQTLTGINLLVTTYLGGADRMWGYWGFGVYTIKTLLLLTGFAVVQVLYARLRIDQMADFGWQALIPTSILQLLVSFWMARS